jgi:hypothetical protein
MDGPLLTMPFFCLEDDKYLSRRVVRRHRRWKGDWPSTCAYEGKGQIYEDMEVSTKRPKNRDSY